MVKLIRNFIFLFLSLAFSASSYADGNGITFGATIGRSTQIISFADTGTVENTPSYVDYKLTYSWPNGMYIGGKYSTLQNISSTGNDNRSGLALVFGYRWNGFYGDLSYFLFSTMQRGNGYTYDAGSSYGFSLGYNAVVISSMYIGIGIVYDYFSWTQSQIGGTKSLVGNSMSDFYPSLNIGYNF
jgi:hypothetical protein